MNKWSPERRRRLAMVLVVAAMASGLIWFALVSTLQNALKAQQTQVDSTRAQLNLTLRGAELATRYEQEAAAGAKRLQSLESQMAYGDTFRWVINRTLDLEDKHGANIADRQRPRECEVEAPPAVPYKGVLYSLVGYGYFHSVGSFLADFENSSPFIRMKSLTIQATASGLAAAREAEKLSFQMDFITLVTTNPVVRP
jgi:hypothetical protein